MKKGTSNKKEPLSRERHEEDNPTISDWIPQHIMITCLETCPGSEASGSRGLRGGFVIPITKSRSSSTCQSVSSDYARALLLDFSYH